MTQFSVLDDDYDAIIGLAYPKMANEEPQMVRFQSFNAD